VYSYEQEIAALVRGGWLTSTQAKALDAYAQSLL